LGQSEALWTWLSSRYQFAVKIGVGQMNVVSGAPWNSDLQRQPQNYVLVPNPPWEEPDEVVRRYVAMPLDWSNSAREQPAIKMNGRAIQFQIVPMRAKDYYRHENAFLLPPTIKEFFMRLIFARITSEALAEIDRRHSHRDLDDPLEKAIAPMRDETSRQRSLEDPYELKEWDQAQTVRCFVHTCNSMIWGQITGTNPPHPLLTAKDYEEVGIPWLDDYRDEQKPLPEKSSITPDRIVRHDGTRRSTEIREFFN
jgi:hypothetical protein